MNVYCIYFPNGKRYIGVESQNGKRIWAHAHMISLNSSNPQPVHLAIRKHGWRSCHWRYLATNCSKRDAWDLEKFFIRVFRLQEKEFGYNVTGGGDTGPLGLKQSDATRAKHRAFGVAHLNTPAAIAKRMESRSKNPNFKLFGGKSYINTKPNKTSFKIGQPAPVKGRIKLPAGPNGEMRCFRPEQLI
jgi:group I intron endonuclease